MRQTLLTLLVLLLARALPLPAHTGPHNECPDATTKVEVQAWWVPDYGHIHATTCFPLLRTYTASTIDLDVRVVLHHNPSNLFKLRFDNGSGGLVGAVDLDLSCPLDETCAWNVPVTLPTSAFRSSGLRIRATTETPDGKRYTTSSDLPLAGGAVNNIQGKGWYDAPVDDYAIAKIHPSSVPLEPVSGVHVFRVRTKKPSDQLLVELDKSHGVPAVGPWDEEVPLAGTTVESFVNQNTGSDWLDVPVNTALLPDGWHTIQFNSRNPDAASSDCDTCSGQPNHLHGVLKLWFETLNGNPVDEPAPGGAGGHDHDTPPGGDEPPPIVSPCPES